MINCWRQSGRYLSPLSLKKTSGCTVSSLSNFGLVGSLIQRAINRIDTESNMSHLYLKSSQISWNISKIVRSVWCSLHEVELQDVNGQDEDENGDLSLLLLVIRHPVTDSGFNQLGVTPAYWSFGLYDSLSWAGNLNGLRYIFWPPSHPTLGRTVAVDGGSEQTLSLLQSQ